MSASTSDDVLPDECVHPVGRLFTGGAETRTIASRRAELGFVKKQTIERLNKDDLGDDLASYVRAPNSKHTQVHFSDPVVTSARDRSPSDASPPPLPRVVASGSASKLLRSVVNVSRLFSPRSSPAVSPARSPASDASFTWDHYPYSSTPPRAQPPDDDNDGDSVYEDSVNWPTFDPIFGNASPLRQGTGTSPARADAIPLRPLSARQQVGDLLRIPTPRRRLPDRSFIDRSRLDSPIRTPRHEDQVQLPPAPNRLLDFNEGEHVVIFPVNPPDNLQVANVDQLINLLPAPPVPALVQPAVDNDDNDYPDDMAVSNDIAIFRGMPNEDARDWIESASLLVDSRRMPNEKAKISLAGMALQDDAKRWLRSLDIRPPHPGDGVAAYPAEAITTFDQFKDRFLAKFQRPQADLWREQLQIYACKQKPGQLTRDYLNELQELAGRAMATPEQTLNAAIAGLRDDVQMFCIGHELPTLDELKKWASVFDSSSKSRAGDVSGTVDRLERLVDRLQVRAATPPRSLTPQRRVRIADDAGYERADQAADYERTPPMQRFERPFSAPAPSPAYGAWRGRGQQGRRGFGGRGGYQGGNRPWKQQGVFTAYDRFMPPSQPLQFQVPPKQQFYGNQGARRSGPNAGGSGFDDFYGNQGSRRQDPNASGSGFYAVCRNCGRGHEWGQCPARSSECRSCGRVGHWSSVCRNSQRQQLA